MAASSLSLCPWESRTYGDSVQTCIAGERDSLIIASLSHLPSSDVIPRCSFEITEEDRRRLANQGVHLDTFDDIGITRARICLDKTKNLVGEETGKELTRGYILTRLENILSNSKKPGAVIYYFGDGKRNTGDWCFKDGFITFKDIAEVYLRVFRGRVLTITTDCSHSGHWVKACMRFLDEQGVRPCGHSAAEKDIFLKVYASCKPHEIAASPCYSVRTLENDKNYGQIMYNSRRELAPTQHPYGYDFTQIRCKRALEEPCGLPPDFTWQKMDQTQRVFLVRGKDRGQPWHYVRLVDDEETIDKFKRETQGEQAGKHSINVADYGQILKTGWGRDPPNDVTEWIEKEYGD